VPVGEGGIVLIHASSVKLSWTKRLTLPYVAPSKLKL
jgi:hypothetical protein